MFPPKPGACAYVIDSTHTEFLITEYTDRVCVFVTQLGKLGTVFQCSLSRDAALNIDTLRGAVAMDADDEDAAETWSDAVRVRTVIGRRDCGLLQACARRVAEVLFSRGCEKYVSRCD
jgi:proteasome assembly chaperone 3